MTSQFGLESSTGSQASGLNPESSCQVNAVEEPSTALTCQLTEEGKRKLLATMPYSEVANSSHKSLGGEPEVWAEDFVLNVGCRNARLNSR